MAVTPRASTMVDKLADQQPIDSPPPRGHRLHGAGTPDADRLDRVPRDPPGDRTRSSHRRRRIRGGRRALSSWQSIAPLDLVASAGCHRGGADAWPGLPGAMHLRRAATRHAGHLAPWRTVRRGRRRRLACRRNSSASCSTATASPPASISGCMTTIRPTPPGTSSTRARPTGCWRTACGDWRSCRSGSMPRTAGRCCACSRRWTRPARTARSST